MTAVLTDAASPVRAADAAAFDVGFSREDGVEVRAPLADVWAVAFELCLPVRRFTPRKGQVI